MYSSSNVDPVIMKGLVVSATLWPLYPFGKRPGTVV
jgi:hypothetical protein